MGLRATLESLRDFDTALLANTLDRIDPTPTHEIYMGREIQSITPDLGPTVGVAVTCQMDTSTPKGGTAWDLYYEQIEQIEAMEEPAVWVVQTVGSRPEHECVMGDGMGKTLYAAGCVGAVIDGGVRDVPGLLSVPFAVYCRGATVHHCAFRCEAINVPVQVGGITVEPGEIIHAGAEGVITIARSAAEELVAQAPRMRALEHEAHAILRRTDIPIAEKRRRVAERIEHYGFENKE